MYSETIPFWKNKEFLVGNSVFLIAVLGLYLFPKQSDPIYNLITYAVFYGAFPIVAIKWVLKQPLEDFGFGWGEWKRGALLMLFGWIVFGMLVVALFRTTQPAFELFAPIGIRTSFAFLLVYTGLSAVVLSGIEILFRGLLQTLWQERIGRWAIVIQAIAFCAWAVLRGKPETLAEIMIVTTIPLWAGWIRRQSRSVWIAFLFSFGASILLSSLALIFL
jgi:membrane protease YdiL (CAAX protease family)